MIPSERPIFRITPKNNHFKDANTCSARLTAYGISLHPDQRLRMSTLCEYDFISLSGNPVKKGDEKLKNISQNNLILLELVNHNVKPNVKVHLNFSISGLKGKSEPILQIFMDGIFEEEHKIEQPMNNPHSIKFETNLPYMNIVYKFILRLASKKKEDFEAKIFFHEGNRRIFWISTNSSY